jgi:Holliday junction resolvase RusA-like endonuclease
MIILEIEGDPVPWKSHGGYGRRSFNPRFKEKEWVQWQIKKQYDGPLLDCAIDVECIFYRAIPKNTSDKKRKLMLMGVIRPTTRPDRGNNLKFLEDCLIGTVIKDDSIIVDGAVRKMYGEKAKTIIKINEVNNAA